MISMDKKYKYRNGEPARVLCVDGEKDSYSVLSMGKNATLHWHTANGAGNATPGVTSQDDLIEINPWEDFKIDEPVMVRDSEDTDWIRSCFAGVDSKGNPTSWSSGKNSWTTSSIIIWKQCRRPTAEELGEKK